MDKANKIISVREDNQSGSSDHFVFNGKDFKEALNLLIREIATRPDKSKRVELWECYDIDGYYDPAIKKLLLKNRENVLPERKRHINKRAMKMICDEFKLPLHMGQLFVNELKLDSDPANDRARQYAKFLGLF